MLEPLPGHPGRAAAGPVRFSPGIEDDNTRRPDPERHPDELSERHAVVIAYAGKIEEARNYLKAGLSILVRCDKLLVPDLVAAIVARSGRPCWELQPPTANDPGSSGLEETAGRRRADLILALQETMCTASSDEIVVVPQLDLLARGGETGVSSEQDELTDLLYQDSHRIILAFVAPSSTVSDVLADRFAVQLAVGTLPPYVFTGDGYSIPMGQALVTRAEAELFHGFDANLLYQQVADMNAVKFRHALHFAYFLYSSDSGEARHTFADLLLQLRIFGARASSWFERPTTTSEDIGGYDHVKYELDRELSLIARGDVEEGLPAVLRQKLIPKGFIFHGPPGTGKNLFAMAIASRLTARVTIVSAEKLLGEHARGAEHELQTLFEAAHYNAPAVLVFDDIDLIAAASQREGMDRRDNTVVPFLIDQLDRLRPSVPVVVIGTTSHLDMLDSRLLKPGRLRPIKIDLPDVVTRRQIAKVQANRLGITISEPLLDVFAEATVGMTGEDILSIFRDAWAEEQIGSHMDAEQLGRLVGMLRAARQQRAT